MICLYDPAVSPALTHGADDKKYSKPASSVIVVVFMVGVKSPSKKENVTLPAPEDEKEQSAKLGFTTRAIL
jgi:hypothetical protein